ncbi:MAG: pantoate--beta-alanine ligase [Bacteroidales bacterium]|jgi:pantoate--beta-alanine ligase|nr:pantoate--beta-alanine ligase [Bacteroidales bacterium]
MTVVETKNALVEALQAYHEKNMPTGFVPTMGALHQGHISLVERCRKENRITVASVFVNPAQFNDKNDLAAYPRTLLEDVEKLNRTGCDFLFAPSVQEMYPEKDTRQFDFGMLDKVMEGAFRPGHFNGVAQIVSRLFDVVQPQRAYFGEKDFQQLAVIRRMVTMMDYPVEIVACPVVREDDGLAMSSRNVRLSPAQREKVPVIAQTLSKSRKKITRVPMDTLKNWVIDHINSVDGLKVEYFEIVDRNTLQSAQTYRKNALQGCVAVHVGDVRLIDNIAY